MQRKTVYQTHQEAQEVVDKRVNEMGRPLWIYPVHDGFCITSKGYNHMDPPAAIMPFERFRAEHPQPELYEGCNQNDITVYRFMAKYDWVSQFYRRPMNTRAVAYLLNQPGTVFVITLMGCDKDECAGMIRRLVESLHQHTGSVIRYVWAYNKTVVMRAGADWDTLDHELRDIRLVYRAISGPNNDAEKKLNGYPRKQSKRKDRRCSQTAPRLLGKPHHLGDGRQWCQ